MTRRITMTHISDLSEEEQEIILKISGHSSRSYRFDKEADYIYREWEKNFRDTWPEGWDIDAK